MLRGVAPTGVLWDEVGQRAPGVYGFCHCCILDMGREVCNGHGKGKSWHLLAACSSPFSLSFFLSF